MDNKFFVMIYKSQLCYKVIQKVLNSLFLKFKTNLRHQHTTMDIKWSQTT